MHTSFIATNTPSVNRQENELSDEFTATLENFKETDWTESRRALDKERLCQPWAIIQISDSYADDPLSDVDDFVPTPAYIASYLRQYPKSADTYCITSEGPFFFTLDYTKTVTPLYGEKDAVHMFRAQDAISFQRTRVVFDGDIKRIGRQPLIVNRLLIQNVTHLFQCKNLLHTSS